MMFRNGVIVRRCAELLARWALILSAIVGTLAQADVVTDWNEVFLKAVRNETTPPCLASRNLAIFHIAIYDAVNAISRTHQPYCFTNAAPKGASKQAAASAAAHLIAVQLYPSRRADFDALQATTLERITNSLARTNGMILGEQAANTILARRREDGASTTVPYFPSKQPGHWRRTPPFFRPPECPQWALVKPFAMTNVAQFRVPPPPALGSARYKEDVEEVGRLGSGNSTNRKSEQTQIARFWSDFSYTVTPPGHWNDISRSIVTKREISIEETARVFALLNIAMADSAISCWDSKYAFDFWRPITAIREASQNGVAETQAAAEWESLLPAPAFPEYTSGHSTFSGAAATVLADVLGSDRVSFTVGCDSLPGETRSFESLWECAKEVGLSRIYGGIHFRSACEVGLTQGKHVAEFVLEHCLTAHQK